MQFLFPKDCILFHLTSFSPMTSLVPASLSLHFPMMSLWGKMQVMHWLVWSRAHANWLAAHTRWLTNRLLPSTAYNCWVFPAFAPAYSLFWISALCSVTGFQKRSRRRMGRWRNHMSPVALGMQIPWELFLSLCCTTLLLPNLLRGEWWGGCYRIFP